MTKYIAVMPFIYRPYRDDCFATMSHLFGQNVLSVNNTENNLGVAESWNCGIDKVKEISADWLIIMSAAIRFGDFGGLDLIEQIEAHPDVGVIHFAKKDIQAQPYERGVEIDGLLGWHLTAINRSVINEVGYFDPNFYPGYFEDIDYDLRINKAIPRVKWLVLPVDAYSESIGHAVEKAGVKVLVNELIAYFATKWGRHPNAAQLGEYDRPFDDQNNSLMFFPAARGRTYNGS